MGQEHLSLMATILAEKEVTQVVVSPGSRNAPAIISFNQSGRLKLWSVPDERSAGFVALGMALQLGETVALLCTSGTAALNYAPALAEAYYQKVPLLVITADRPAAWIDQGDGQTIRQQGVFSNYVRKSFHLPHEVSSAADYWQFTRMVSEAIDRTQYPAPGPVHLNLPLQEPLYDIQPYEFKKELRISSLIPADSQLPAKDLQKLATAWNAAGSKMILAGQLPPGNELTPWLNQLSDDPSVVVFTETQSNLNIKGGILCIDRTIEGISGKRLQELAPTILLTLGGAIVSKKIKALLAEMHPAQHWHINPDPDDFYLDTYQALTHTILCSPEGFLRQFVQLVHAANSNYREQWQQLALNHLEKHKNFLSKAPFSDLKVFETLFRAIPKNHLLHVGNSTPIRYSQLFDVATDFATYSNRGTSGIDGSVSTAVGAAAVSPQPITLITGDMGFLYDSNALWNTKLPPNIKIILINNGGGNIFRFIPGPDRFAELEPYIEASHSFRAEGIAKNFGLSYYSADDAATLQAILPVFFGSENKNTPSLLEIVTPPKISAQVLKDYFKFIKS